MSKRRQTKKCPLFVHLAAPNGCCVGCGKRYQVNRSKPRRKQTLSNPAEPPKRIGRAKKFYYDRDQGNRQGLYQHTFTRRNAGVWTYPAGWAFLPTKSVVVR